MSSCNLHNSRSANKVILSGYRVKLVLTFWRRTEEIIVTKKSERANTLKEVQRLCNQFGLTSGMLNDSLAEGRRPKIGS